MSWNLQNNEDSQDMPRPVHKPNIIRNECTWDNQSSSPSPDRDLQL